MALAKRIISTEENQGNGVSRRNFLTAALAVGAATPAAAFVGPADPEAPPVTLPEWWERKLAGLTRQEQIEHHAEAILALVEQDAPASERGAVCRVSRGDDGRARFDAQMRDGSMETLNPQTLAWV